jgi:hypothetical protein
MQKSNSSSHIQATSMAWTLLTVVIGFMLYLLPGEPCLVAKNQHIWKDWADTLHRWGVQDVIATLLEATGPLNFIGAQVVYLGQPIITHILPEDHINAFADLLENPEETKAFTHFLRQEHRVD